jgi:hypothetical protein
MSQSTPLEDRRLRRSTPSQERPLLAMSICLVLAYTYSTSSYQHTYLTVPLPQDPRVMRTYPRSLLVHYRILFN